jgi:acyl-CoA thioesterase I
VPKSAVTLTANNTRSALMIWRTLLLVCILALSGPTLADVASPRILVIGDSLMATNRMLGGSVAQALSETLAVEVKDNSTIGARYFFRVPIAGLNIAAQVQDGPWDYVVVNGGGNDLLFGCGCGACTRMMNRLISADGTLGAIPELVGKLRKGGAKVIYTGYMRTPGVISPVEGCGPLGDEMDRRLAQMADRDDGVQFLLLADLVKIDGDKSYHSIDLVHPSIKGSRAIADLLAALITD